jgi:hypothetical protein
MMEKKLTKTDLFETESVFIFCFRIFPKFRVQIDLLNLESENSAFLIHYKDTSVIYMITSNTCIAFPLYG